MMHMVKHKCMCGSGKRRYPLYDAAGTFCTYVCDSCVDKRTKEFNPAIFLNGSLYSASGDERDITEEERM